MTKYINSHSQLEKDGATYNSFNTTVRGNIWVVCVVFGKYNYISVRKVSNNPFGTVGKQFDTLDEALNHYKSTEMRNMLRYIESKFDIITGKSLSHILN